MVAARVFHINLLLMCETLQCVVSFIASNYSIKQIPTLLDFSSLDGTVCYTVSATWECLEHSDCVTESLVVLSLIWHTKVKAKSDWIITTYIKADYNTITPFGVKVMSQYKVLLKRECGVIKNTNNKQPNNGLVNVLLGEDQCHTTPHRRWLSCHTHIDGPNCPTFIN